MKHIRIWVVNSVLFLALIVLFILSSCYEICWSKLSFVFLCSLILCLILGLAVLSLIIKKKNYILAIILSVLVLTVFSYVLPIASSMTLNNENYLLWSNKDKSIIFRITCTPLSKYGKIYLKSNDIIMKKSSTMFGLQSDYNPMSEGEYELTEEGNKIIWLSLSLINKRISNRYLKEICLSSVSFPPP